MFNYCWFKIKLFNKKDNTEKLTTFGIRGYLITDRNDDHELV